MMNWPNFAAKPPARTAWPQPAPAQLADTHPRSSGRRLACDLGDDCWRQAMQVAGLGGLLHSPGDIQLLVPSDRAFTDLLHELRLSQAALFADLPRLRRILLGHVVMGADGLEPARPGAMLRTANQNIVHLLEGGRIRDALGRQAQTLGQIATRPGLTPTSHLIDRVMLPAELGLLDLLAENPAHHDFLDALQRTGIASWLHGSGPFTVLAPCNASWRAQLADLELTPGRSLASLLSRHLLAGRWLSDEMPWGGSLTTLSGEPLRLSPLGLLGNGAQVQALRSGSNKLARNGVLHLIEKVSLLAP